ncbi:hypothetical protein [uncultured Pelagimonas sp.]|uniref:hypothetical protein n=1 Tax=uncultured Pelagimonas sp. TaxID=1618102 RepID=UPI00260664DB|nr:hypothetical protein [uncultured Pelagimonas sp.]
MDEITPEWLKARLGTDRGQKAALAEALGLSNDKVSKMLGGTRKPQAQEIPTILAFFGETTATTDPELQAVWQKLTPSERLFLLNAAKAQISARESQPLEPPEDSG